MQDQNRPSLHWRGGKSPKSKFRMSQSLSRPSSLQGRLISNNIHIWMCIKGIPTSLLFFTTNDVVVTYNVSPSGKLLHVFQPLCQLIFW
jgi:hypothetical protein